MHSDTKVDSISVQKFSVSIKSCQSFFVLRLAAQGLRSMEFSLIRAFSVGVSIRTHNAAADFTLYLINSISCIKMTSSANPSQFDILIIGSGAAGLTLALRTADFARVAVLSKGKLSQGATFYAQGGIAAVLDSHRSCTPCRLDSRSLRLDHMCRHRRYPPSSCLRSRNQRQHSCKSRRCLWQRC